MKPQSKIFVVGSDGHLMGVDTIIGDVEWEFCSELPESRPIFGSNSSGKTIVDKERILELAGLKKAKSGLRPIRANARPSRNEPCPCGSGRKFKHCCLPKIQERA